MTRSRTNLLFCLALTVTACGKGEGDEDVRGVTCDDVLDTDLVMQIDALGDRPVTEALVVTGGVVHKRGFAVHRVTVLDEAAENVEFNFTRWSATLSAETLKARRNGDGMLTVDATAVDTCGNEQSADVTIKLVEPVASLAFAEPGIPGGESFLPADGTTPATLELTANAEAAGATVSLQVSGGGLFPGLSSNDVVLSGDGSAPAKATFLLTASTAGTIFITASAQGEIASLPITVAAPPTISPSTADLSPGAVLSLLVESEGRVASCQATPTPDVTVVSQGQDISTSPVSYAPGTTKPTITVSVAPTATSAATVTITCRDPFFQTAEATVTVTP